MSNRIRSPRDFWSGLVFMAIAAGFIVLASRYGYGTLHRMGPAMFPTLVGGLLALLGAVLAIRSFAVDGPKLDPTAWRPLVVTVLAIALFGVALRPLGLVAAIVLLVVVGSFATPVRHPASIVVLAATLTAFSVAVFAYLLGLPLPLWPAG